MNKKLISFQIKAKGLTRPKKILKKSIFNANVCIKFEKSKKKTTFVP